MKRDMIFAVDRGGTFTDVYALARGRVWTEKLLSEDPVNYPDAPREGIRRLLERILGREIHPGAIPTAGIAAIRMGTTVATNALLERTGEPCCLVITQGLADLPRIGFQDRPDIFALNITRPGVLFTTVVEARERIRPRHPADRDKGLPEMGGTAKAAKTTRSSRSYSIVQPLDLEALEQDLRRVRSQGIRSLAVALMHGYMRPEHELAVESLARKLGFSDISLSHQVMPRARLTSRADTTCVDAYLTPAIMRYVQDFRRGFQDGLEGVDLLFMQSDGGLTRPGSFRGSAAVLSGPAGGVAGCRTLAAAARGRPLITFDMGGTSTDTARLDPDYELVFETETAGVRIQAPQLDIRTVAAGGGSRLFFRNNMLTVGPESAGAHPGPVCYRKGGHVALTDANLVLGRLQPEFFPRIFGPDEDQPLDIEASRQALKELAAEINAHNTTRGLPVMGVEEVAQGFLDVADEIMARPIRELSVMRGHDIRDHVLACFGGAGGQHACAMARRLGIGTILISRHAGVLSAVGLALAETSLEREEPVAEVLDAASLPGLRRRLKELEERACSACAAQRPGAVSMSSRGFLNLRYQDTDTSFMVECGLEDDPAEAFTARHHREFGFVLPGRPIVVDGLRVRVTAPGPAPPPVEAPMGPPAEPETLVDCWFGTWQRVPLYLHHALRAGQEIQGPAIIIQDTSTVVVEPGCLAALTTEGDLRIHVPRPGRASEDTSADPVRLAVFGNLFMSVAEQMGRTLRKTAMSTNIKERLDFSCAIFDRTGGLCANAPHVPVHLGAMGEAVRAQLELCPDLRPGDVLLSNHPAAGGSHLPDMTVITPVFSDGDLLFFTASRGHHADVGGIQPGSMPPFSRELQEEGLALHSFLLLREGRFRSEALQALMEAMDHPPRRPGELLADLKAQVAANRRGAALLEELMERHGREVVLAYMGHIQDNAAAAVRSLLRGLAEQHGCNLFTAEDRMDDGSPVRLRVEIGEDGTAVFDFSGTGPEVHANWNCPRAVTLSAILYCLRCLVGQDIPLNQGCLEPVELRLPPASLLSPSENAAVAGGNVLTSQRIVDVILRAFRAAANSQGCMNNISFGTRDFGYYETLAGGTGAGPGFAGADGVHSHMTNTRITDPEILELRYPVMVRRFALRPDSGGAGRYPGGQGLVREIEFLDDMEVAVLSERRVFAPQGLAGGGPGARGRNLLWRAGAGYPVNLGGKNRFTARPGDRIEVLTPGGGGYGSPSGEDEG